MSRNQREGRFIGCAWGKPIRQRTHNVRLVPRAGTARLAVFARARRLEQGTR